MNDRVRMLRCNEMPVLRTALERDPSIASKPQIVVEAARWGRLEAMKLLLRGGADLNAAWRGCPPPRLVRQDAARDGQSADSSRAVERSLSSSTRRRDLFILEGREPRLLPGSLKAAGQMFDEAG